MIRVLFFLLSGCCYVHLKHNKIKCIVQPFSFTTFTNLLQKQHSFAEITEMQIRYIII